MKKEGVISESFLAAQDIAEFLTHEEGGRSVCNLIPT